MQIHLHGENEGEKAYRFTWKLTIHGNIAVSTTILQRSNALLFAYLAVIIIEILD